MKDTHFASRMLTCAGALLGISGILIAIDEILAEKRIRHIDTFAASHPEEVKLTSGANKIIFKPGSGE